MLLISLFKIQWKGLYWILVFNNFIYLKKCLENSNYTVDIYLCSLIVLKLLIKINLNKVVTKVIKDYSYLFKTKAFI